MAGQKKRSSREIYVHVDGVSRSRCLDLNGKTAFGSSHLDLGAARQRHKHRVVRRNRLCTVAACKPPKALPRVHVVHGARASWDAGHHLAELEGQIRTLGVVVHQQH